MSQHATPNYVASSPQEKCRILAPTCSLVALLRKESDNVVCAPLGPITSFGARVRHGQVLEPARYSLTSSEVGL